MGLQYICCWFYFRISRRTLPASRLNNCLYLLFYLCLEIFTLAVKQRSTDSCALSAVYGVPRLARGVHFLSAVVNYDPLNPKMCGLRHPFPTRTGPAPPFSSKRCESISENFRETIGVNPCFFASLLPCLVFLFCFFQTRSNFLPPPRPPFRVEHFFSQPYRLRRHFHIFVVGYEFDGLLEC